VDLKKVFVFVVVASKRDGQNYPQCGFEFKGVCVMHILLI